MKIFKNVWAWLRWSSADPARMSLTVRGILIGIIPTVLYIASMACGFGVVCLGVDEPLLNQFAESVAAAVQAFFTLVAAVMVVIGFIRKVILTAQGNTPTSGYNL